MNDKKELRQQLYKKQQWGNLYPLKDLSEDIEQIRFCIQNDKYTKNETLEALNKLQNKMNLTIDYYKEINTDINELEYSLEKWQKMYYKKFDLCQFLQKQIELMNMENLQSHNST